jgi:outer membrane protein OmpA-like peptidoglycan-associated protein
MKLSKNRASSVVDYLTEKGVDSGRLDSVGYGEKNPLDSNKTKEGRANNRRVEISHIK